MCLRCPFLRDWVKVFPAQTRAFLNLWFAKPIPEGPNLEKIRVLGTRLKFSSEIETSDIFKRDWIFQASHPGILQVKIEQFKRDWSFQARLKISSESLKFSSVQARLFFFKIRAFWVWFACGSPFTKTAEITTMKTTKTTQTATNKELSPGLAAITETTEMMETTGIHPKNLLRLFFALNLFIFFWGYF